MKNLDNILTNKRKIILILILAGILRIWQLTSVPPSIYWDEASLGYNAYSILKTGKDEYGNFMPLLFRSFDTYNPMFSVYLLVPSVALFGLTEFAVRFPASVFGTITVLITYLLVLELKFTKTTALTAALFLAISSWHVHFSRFYHETNIMVFFTLSGALFFLKGRSKDYFLAASALAFGVAINTAHQAKLWVPLFITTLTFFHFRQVYRSKRIVLGFVLIYMVAFLPILTNIKDSLVRPSAVSIFEAGGDKLAIFINGYLSHFSWKFLFFSGDSIGRHSVPGLGQLYPFQIPLILIGLITLLKQKSKSSGFLLTWLLLAPIPAALSLPVPHAARSLTFIPLWSILSALGSVKLLNSSHTRLKIIIAFLLLPVAIYNVVSYVHLYYSHYPKTNAYDWQDGHRELYGYVKKVENNYQTIAVTSFYAQPYIFALFYLRYDPSTYQKQAEDKNRFDKFEFFGQNWGKTKPGKALIITPPWQAHPSTILKEVKDNGGNVIFTVSEEI